MTASEDGAEPWRKNAYVRRHEMTAREEMTPLDDSVVRAWRYLPAIPLGDPGGNITVVPILISPVVEIMLKPVMLLPTLFEV